MISLRDVVTGFGNRDPLAEVWRRSLRGGGGGSAVITGVPPLRYIGDGRPLTDYLISGNAVQDGTPSADAPVDAVGCGVRTGNLFDPDTVYGTYKQNDGTYRGTVNDFYTTHITPFTPDDVGKTFTFTMVVKETTSINVRASANINGSGVNGNNLSATGITTVTFTVSSVNDYLYLGYGGGGANPIILKNIMLNEGSTALPYEPYGFKLPLTVNGVEYPIYLGTVPTTRRIKKLVLTGEENYTEYSFSGTLGVYVSNALDTKYTRAMGICSHYPVSTSATVNTLWIGVNDTRLYFVGIRDALGVETSAEVKAWVTQQYAAGTPVTVWYALAEPETGIVNEPLMKIGDYADTISFAQAGVTIPTVSGENILDVPTEVPPSEIAIKGGISSV